MTDREFLVEILPHWRFDNLHSYGDPAYAKGVDLVWEELTINVNLSFDPKVNVGMRYADLLYTAEGLFADWGHEVRVLKSPEWVFRVLRSRRAKRWLEERFAFFSLGNLNIPDDWPYITVPDIPLDRSSVDNAIKIAERLRELKVTW